MYRLILPWGALIVLLSAAPASAAERPNILFILTDDQAPWATGLTDPLGNAITPNMDSLIRQGAQLNRCYTPTPVCSPSRTSLMTSRYGTELGITDWIHPAREEQLGVDPEVVMWPELLQQAGYHSGLVGKWHLGIQDRHHPTRNGFDYFMGHRAGGWSTENPKLEKDGQYQQFEGLTTDILADHAITFLEEAADRKDPFLLCWHTRAPHTRWLPVAEEDWAPYAEPFEPEIPNPDYPKLDVERVKRSTREYLASVRGVDRNIGRVLETLDRLQLRGDTLIVFTSDHGYSMGHNGIWHKGNGHWMLTEPPPATENIPRGQRPNMYDTSIFVPTGIVWPGVIEPGSQVDQTISFLDFFPTLLAVADVEPPQELTLRGRDFLPLLKGQAIEDWNNDAYGEYSTHHQSTTHMRMWRTDRWKLVRDFLNPERDKLYDLERDPGEANNLIGSDGADIQQVVNRLHQKIVERMKAVDDPVLSSVKTK